MPAHRTHQLLLWLSAFLLAFFMSNRLFNDGMPGWKHIVTSDGRGYYAYLPALLIDGDPTFTKTVEREAKLLGYPNYKPGYIVRAGERNLNKYFAGEALLLLPFFLLGWLASLVTGQPADGYSFFFQTFTGIGALFYLLAGFLFLDRLLKHFNLRSQTRSIVILLLFFGTNLFYYSLWQPTMSHIYSFFAINGFCLYIKRASEKWNLAHALPAALFLGLTILIRPTNAVVLLLVPFLINHNHLKMLADQLFREKLVIILFLLIVFLIVMIQPLLWTLQTGKLALWPYSNEGFRFNDPQFFNILFSFGRGFFLYTPLMAVSLAGFFFIRDENGLRWTRGYWLKLTSIALFAAISTYIIASWWNWYYGDGFGLRAFIDYYGIYGTLLALLIDKFRNGFGRVFIVALVAPLVLLNLVQTWQYTHKVMQPHSMNREKYEFIFFRTDSAVRGSLGGNAELPDYTINTIKPVKVFHHDFEKDRPEWIPGFAVATGNTSSGKYAGMIDRNYPYSATIQASVSTLGKLPCSFYVEGEVNIRDSLPGASNSVLVVLSCDSVNPGENWWYAFKINDTPHVYLKRWSRRTFSLMTPVIHNPAGIVKIYLFQPGRNPLLMDDFRVTLYGHTQQ